MKHREITRATIIAGTHELTNLRQALADARNVNIDFIELEADRESSDPLRNLVDQVRCTDPHMLVLGQTPLAEELLSRLRLPATPFVVRYSIFYNTGKSGYGGHSPTEAGYHIDIPKKPEAVQALLENENLLQSIRDRDTVAVRDNLTSKDANIFPGLDRWHSSPTPPPDFHTSMLLYLDVDGIDLLFQQSGLGHLQQIVRKTSNASTAKLGFNVTLGKVLEMFGIGSAKLAGDLTEGSTVVEEATQTFSTIAKLKVIMDEMAESQSLHILRGYESKLPNAKLYADIEAWFDTSDIAHAIKNEQEFGEYRCLDYPIRMGGSFKKYELGLHHVASYFRDGTEARLRAFGAMAPVGDGQFYFKPYAFGFTELRR